MSNTKNSKHTSCAYIIAINDDINDEQPEILIRGGAAVKN